MIPHSDKACVVGACFSLRLLPYVELRHKMALNDVISLLLRGLGLTTREKTRPLKNEAARSWVV